MERLEEESYRRNLPVCDWCNQQQDMATGIYDEGEWMRGDCVSVPYRATRRSTFRPTENALRLGVQGPE